MTPLTRQINPIVLKRFSEAYDLKRSKTSSLFHEEFCLTRKNQGKTVRGIAIHLLQHLENDVRNISSSGRGKWVIYKDLMKFIMGFEFICRFPLLIPLFTNAWLFHRITRKGDVGRRENTKSTRLTPSFLSNSLTFLATGIFLLQNRQLLQWLSWAFCLFVLKSFEKHI